MKTETAIVLVAVVVAGVVIYKIYQDKNSQLAIGRNGITGQINLSQAGSAIAGIATAIGNAFGGGHASSGGGYGDSQTSYMDTAGGIYDSYDGSTDDSYSYDV